MPRKKIIYWLILLAIIIAGAAVYTHSRKSDSPHSSTPQQTSFSNKPIDHIVIIVEENKPKSAIVGNAAAPYINSLLDTYASAVNYYGITHPSLPNYIALTSGTAAGITANCNPPSSSCQANVPNIADEIEKSGRSWKEYTESMPTPCGTSNSGKYAVKHNPFMYFPQIRNDKARCDAHVVPFTQFSTDLTSKESLPDYTFITPDMCNDMHDCSISTGDIWLSKVVPSILKSPAFTEQHSLLVVTWDEGSRTDNNIPTIFAGPAAKKGYQSTDKYDHYSLLHTIETQWKLNTLTQNDANASVMNSLLR
jgi:acid phosphatase